MAKARGQSVRKILFKAEAFKNAKEPQLKIETLRASTITKLYVLINGSIVITWVFGIMFLMYLRTLEDSVNLSTLQHHRYVEYGAISVLRILSLVMIAFYLTRIYQAEKCYPVQTAISSIAISYGLLSLVMLVHDTFEAGSWADEFDFHCPKDQWKVRTWVNAIQAALGYGVLIFVSRCYQNQQMKGDVESKAILSALVLVLYIVLRLVISYHLDIAFDFMPLTNFATAFRIRMDQIGSNQDFFWGCSAITISDLVLTFWAWYELRKARESFRNRFIHDIRSLYMGFHFFMFNNARILLAMIAYGAMIACLIPLSYVYDGVPYESAIRCTGTPVGVVGYYLSITVWLFSAMYGSLPAKHGNGTPNSNETSSSVKYFAREGEVYLREGYTNLLKSIEQVNPTHFIMEQQIEFFNFAYLAYACGHKSYQQDTVNFQRMIGNPLYKIVQHIHDAASDTHCLIFQSRSRIVVAFKGTSSVQNARTDINVTKLYHPTAASFELEKGELPSFMPRSIPRPNCCKSDTPWVHKGFWTAYASVRDRVLQTLRQLLEEESRTVVLTGHSLGGALATLCAFDVVNELHTRQVAVTTFGSPRVGGNAFKRKYNHAVPATFRIVNASDLISETPVRTLVDSFTDVGTTVLMDRTGNMLIDPNLLEYDLIHRGVSAEAHSLTSYQYAMLLYCLRAHHGRFKPKFWPHSLQKLRVKYGHLGHIDAYLRRASLVTTSSTQSKLSEDELALILQNNLTRCIGRSNFFSRGSNDFYNAREAIEYLIESKLVTNTAEAEDCGRLLVAKGYIILLGGSYTFEPNAKFKFKTPQ